MIHILVLDLQQLSSFLYLLANAIPVPIGSCAPTISCPPKNFFQRQMRALNHLYLSSILWLYVYHATVKTGSENDSLLQTMEKKLLRYIINPECFSHLVLK